MCSTATEVEGSTRPIQNMLAVDSGGRKQYLSAFYFLELLPYGLT